MSALYRDVSVLLEGIEAEMRRLELWSEQPPTVEALASEQPFCVDTLSFQQWLQYVFLSTLRAIIDQQGALPETCQVAPMAEMAFTGSGEDTRVLLDLLCRVDSCLSAPR